MWFTSLFQLRRSRFFQAMSSASVFKNRCRDLSLRIESDSPRSFPHLLILTITSAFTSSIPVFPQYPLDYHDRKRNFRIPSRPDPQQAARLARQKANKAYLHMSSPCEILPYKVQSFKVLTACR